MSSTNKELKALIAEFNQDFKISSEASRKEVLSNLKSGERAPESGRIYGENNREEFNNRARQYAARATELVQKEIDKVNDAMTEAPTDEAVRALTVVGLRDDVSKEEFDALFERRREDLEGLGRSLRSTLTLRSAEDHSGSAGFTSLQLGSIDAVIPEE